MSLRVHDEAKSEVFTAFQFFHNIRPSLGEAFMAMYEARLQSIEAAPESFAKYTYRPKGTDIRFTVLRRFRFAIYFERFGHEVFVLSVGHGSRKPGYWLKRRSSI